MVVLLVFFQTSGTIRGKQDLDAVVIVATARRRMNVELVVKIC